jgi:hypothetical protein
MDPNLVRLWQVWLWIGACLVPALLFGRLGALLVALATAVTALCWALLARHYRYRHNRWVSPERLEGDKMMDVNGLLAFGTSIAFACAVAALGLEPVLEPAWTAVPCSLPLLTILLSSAVDWYVILPFRDGIAGLPACRIDEVGVQARRRYTKLWVAHRLICELSIGASLLAVGVLLINHYAHGLEPIVTIAGALGISAAGAQVAWDRWVLGGLRFCMRQGPALGNWVAGPSFTKREGERKREGFVLDVSLDNGLKIVAAPGATEYFIALKDAVPDISLIRDGYACRANGCRAWLRTDRGEDKISVSCEIYRKGFGRNQQSSDGAQ